MTMGERIKAARLKKGYTQSELAELLGYKSRSSINKIEVEGRDIPRSSIVKFAQVLDVTPSYLMGWEEPKLKNIDFDISVDDSKPITKESVINALDDAKNLFLQASEELHLKMYRILDEYGKQAVDGLLKIEYERCTTVEDLKEEEPTITINHSTYKVSAGTGFELGEGDSWETIEVPDSPETRKADFALTIQGDSMEPVYFDGDIVLVKEQPSVDIGEIGIFTINGDGYIKKYGGDRLISLNAVYDDIIFSEHDDDCIRCIGKVIGRV